MDLHPEDLLEREIRGELSAAEQERLDLHARQCAVCHLERRARHDFLRDSESPEAEADVARLLAAMAGPLALHGLPRAPKASPMRYLRFVAAAAAVVSVTGFAAAAGWSGVRSVLPWVAPAANAPSVPSQPAAPVASAVPAPRRAVAVVAVTPPAEAVEVEAPLQAPLPRDVAPAPARVLASPAPAPARPLAVARVVAPAVVEPTPTPPSAELADAATMFHRANEARQAGDHLRAGELYGLLLNRYPGAPEAHASLAMFGRMLLDDGNPNGALQCFDDYLRNGGALREDVMVGRALAFQRIGPRATSDEARAWTSLLDAYPGSVHAQRARRRLSDLERL